MQPITSPHFSVSAGTIAKAIAVAMLALALFYLRDVVLVVLTAVVLASAIEPFARTLRRWHIARLPAVILIYLAFALVAVAIFYFVVPALVSDVVSLLGNVPVLLNTVSTWSPFGVFGAEAALGTGVEESAPLAGKLAFGDMLEAFRIVAANVSEGFLPTLSVFFGGAVSFVLIIVLSFYLAVQEDGIAKFLGIVTPIKHEAYVIGLWRRAQEKIGLWMQGQLLLAVLVGLLVYLGLTVLGIENALALAFLAAVMETIPLFGPIIAAIPAVAAAYLFGGVSSGLLTVGLYLIIQQFENHLFYPLVVKKIIGVPPILVILSLIIGAKLAGFLGLLLSVPLATTVMEYLNDLQRRKISTQSAHA
ncbi:MAG: hypothetical protein G01um101417_124 [Parcubacteria group bacterium Gr01-1014_17]|nr:MAG: hypothetical protein G01um101417_124 [Parcubacteria group bacterium Gr01-1014_17]